MLPQQTLASRKEPTDKIPSMGTHDNQFESGENNPGDELETGEEISQASAGGAATENNDDEIAAENNEDSKLTGKE